MATKLSDAELMEHFINVAKEIQNRCNDRNAFDCDSGNCPFSKDKHCIFNWKYDMKFPFDWHFDEEDDDQ